MLVIGLFHLQFILKMLGTMVLNLIVGDTILLYYIHVSTIYLTLLCLSIVPLYAIFKNVCCYMPC